MIRKQNKKVNSEKSVYIKKSIVIVFMVIAAVVMFAAGCSKNERDSERLELRRALFCCLRIHL